MKVPQTFTITLEQAGFLAQMKAGQRSSWIRSAIDNYRAGPVAAQRLLERWVYAANEFQKYLETLGEDHHAAVTGIHSRAFVQDLPHWSEE